MFPELTRDDVFRIETRRLWLRWPRMNDVAAIARQAGEKAVAEMTARIPVGYTEPEAAAFVLAARQANADGQGIVLAITPVARPDQVIGVISVTTTDGSQPVLGYWLAVPVWGHGLATEAAQAIVDATFTLSSAPHISATTVPINGASQRVLKKCGFTHTGGGMHDAPARGGAQPVEFFRLDRSVWRSLKGWREPRFQRGEAQMQQGDVAA